VVRIGAIVGTNSEGLIMESWQEVSELITQFGDERNLAGRLRKLRESKVDENGRPWSQEELARRMTAAGYPMTHTSVWKIENADKKSGGRSVPIGEAIGFARVLGVSLAELLLPESAVTELAVWRAFQDATEALNEVRRQWAVYAGGIERVRAAVAESSGIRSRIADYLESAEADRLRQIGDVWINDADDETERRTRAQLVAQDPRRLPAGVEDGYAPTPAIVAARHVLADDPIAPSILVKISEGGA